MNFVSGTTIYVAYEMLREDKKYDLCYLLWSEIIKNLKKIEENKKNSFKYGYLLFYMFLYFKNEILGVGHVEWGFDRPIGV